MDFRFSLLQINQGRVEKYATRKPVSPNNQDCSNNMPLISVPKWKEYRLFHSNYYFLLRLILLFKYFFYALPLKYF